MAPAAPDFQRIFEQSPEVLCVLLPDAPKYTMVAATRARLEITHTTLEQTVGVGIFELFPDNPDDPAATGSANLRASLDRVTTTRMSDTMAVQQYDIRLPDGTFETRYWSPKNLPVLSPTGELLYILHRVEDVTELVRASEQGEELRGRTRAMEREVLARSQELAAANRDLRDANTRLGELDAAKTAFFNNISHEFRTPLTLMLGPLEDAIAEGASLPAEQRQRLTLAHDNALRLLRLVTALLDFARLEAGRMRTAYAPLDLAAFTAELAMMFESAVEKAGLDLVVECPALSTPIWIDRDLWERVIPNLLSNAFKFTMEGRIAVRTSETPSAAVVEVSDTGLGIPAEELPRLFERFHRVDGAAGRTHEGTGIGLSLVRELVELHGGSITAESELGRGTTFRIEIPKGFAHLPQEHVSHVPASPHTLQAALAHVTEAAHWLAPQETGAPISIPSTIVAPAGDLPPPQPVTSTPGASRRRPLVVVVDDNADLRRYLAGLIAPFYEVVTAVDGVDALRVIKQSTAAIVISDVMMPNLDGFGLIRALRADPQTAALPIILLSARAGEEATVEGLAVGADDYLMKPFSARELIARVRTHIELASMRRAFITELERANRELDSFSYSVSHDLRAPLRAIDGFSGFLAEEYGAGLDARAQDYVTRIRTAVTRMRLLVDSLLELSKLSRATVAERPVDLTALAHDAIDELRRANPERQVAVTIAPGLVARGDHRLLSVLLTNLLGNAWKFTGRAADARIEVAQQVETEDRGETVFFVRDNGAGFDMAYADKLFTPFQRLHNPAEFDGTGIGLASVQRVIARHRGRLWAEATVGQGATFYFALPSGSV